MYIKHKTYTYKAGKYNKCVDTVTVTRLPCIIVIHFGNRMTCVIIYCPQHSWCHATHWMFLHKIMFMLQGITNYQYKVSMQDRKDDNFYCFYAFFAVLELRFKHVRMHLNKCAIVH